MQVVHCKRDSYTKYIGRGSIYGNPFTHLPVGTTKAPVQVSSVDEAVDCYEAWLRGDPKWAWLEPARRLRILQSLLASDFTDKDVLGCFCRPRHRCHGDVLDKLYQEIKLLGFFGHCPQDIWPVIGGGYTDCGRPVGSPYEGQD